jgi:hypothetical protein
MWRSRWWRKAAAVASGMVFIVTAALGINAGYGLNPTLGAMLGMNQTQHLALPKLTRVQQTQSGPPCGKPGSHRQGYPLPDGAGQ